jgi:hypothetical protein
LEPDLILLSDLDVRPVAAWSADFPIGRIALRGLVRAGVEVDRVEVWIGTAILYDAADSGEQPVRTTRDGLRIKRRK